MADLRLEGSRVLVATLGAGGGAGGEAVKALTGSMVAYDGQVTFKKATFGGEGIRGALKRKVTGEALDLMECAGSGTVWFAAEGREVQLVPLHGDRLMVEASSLLALTSGLSTNMVFSGLRGVTSGQGLTTTTVTGTGTVAFVSDGPPIALEVAPSYPLVVDPDAYVAHTGQLQQSFVTDVSWKSVLGQGSGEPFSLRFDGSGVVYIQPAER